MTTLSGGCQCGAVRFSVARIGRATICHCRMCQKAFGSFFAPLVPVEGLVWTRGKPTHFQSSDKNWRGFCGKCGTPLTYEFDGGVELAIGAFDNPARAAPLVQVNAVSRQPFFDDLVRLPEVDAAETARNDGYNATVISNQHPDHDTETWPPRSMS
jgi:hypothetical protein